jgi:signal peptidase I
VVFWHQYGMSVDTSSGPHSSDPLAGDPFVEPQPAADITPPVEASRIEEQALLPIEFTGAGAEHGTAIAQADTATPAADAPAEAHTVIAEPQVPIGDVSLALAGAPPASLEVPVPIASLVADAEDRTAAAWSRMWREIVSGVQTLVSAAVYATLIVTFGFQVARVDGLSMAPTLEDHDRLIVNKLVYEIGDPRPGDIVMLYYPLNPEKMFVKRVIAREGDTVRIVDGRVYVNDVPLHDDYVPAEFRSHDDWGPQVIQQGYYFVMGDHRNNSSDSRHWGQVPKKYIVGKVKVRWWPLQDARIF